MTTSTKEAMTTNDTKALISELRAIRLTMRETTTLLEWLVKQAQKAEARDKATEFKWPPTSDDAEADDQDHV